VGSPSASLLAFFRSPFLGIYTVRDARTLACLLRGGATNSSLPGTARSPVTYTYCTVRGSTAYRTAVAVVYTGGTAAGKGLLLPPLPTAAAAATAATVCGAGCNCMYSLLVEASGDDKNKKRKRWLRRQPDTKKNIDKLLCNNQ